jgi:cysteine desulfurase
LYSLFGLNPEEFNLYYHSGATEGINAFFKSQATQFFKEKKSASFFFSQVDHACVVELVEDLTMLGAHVHFFSVNKRGDFDLDELISKIKQESASGRIPFVNFTYVNNETGVVWPLSLAEKIKEETGAFIHVDAVQLVGKIEHWQILSPKLDAFTFSGHKFGAMKGIGFSFFKKSLNFTPFLRGGGQQGGFRAGTENALGVYSLKLALGDIVEHFDPIELMKAKTLIENSLTECLGSLGEIVGHDQINRNLNTIFLILYGQKAEVMSTRFDLQGMDISTGSACSSGIIKENRVLLAMGYGARDSKSAIRFSFSPFMNQVEAHEYFLKIKQTLSAILKIK